MNKKIFIALLTLALSASAHMAMAATEATNCGSAPTVPAATATDQDRQQYREQMQQYNQCQRGALNGERQNVQEQKQALTQDRCNLVNQRINDRLSNFQNKQNGDTTIFGNIYQRLSNISTRLKKDNLDTTKLEGDLATLKTKIDKVSTGYASFIDGLKGTQDFVCGHSQGEFMGKLGDARNILLSVRQDRLDVKSYVLNTIRPDILTLRQQLAKQEQADKSTTNSDSTGTTAPTVSQ